MFSSIETDRSQVNATSFVCVDFVMTLNTRKEPAQARNYIACVSAEDVFVDVTWSVCISIKQFNIEFKVRSHLGNTNIFIIFIYITSLVSVIFIFYMYIVLFL